MIRLASTPALAHNHEKHKGEDLAAARAAVAGCRASRLVTLPSPFPFNSSLHWRDWREEEKAKHSHKRTAVLALRCAPSPSRCLCALTRHESANRGRERGGRRAPLARCLPLPQYEHTTPPHIPEQHHQAAAAGLSTRRTRTWHLIFFLCAELQQQQRRITCRLQAP